MKKILIYEPEYKLKSTGGPEGYLYNLKLGLDAINYNDIQIEFLKGTDPGVSATKKIANKLPAFVKGILKIVNAFKLYSDMTKGKLENRDIDFNNYDYIHFHYTFDLYKNKKKLGKFKGKIILTSHSPKPYFLEYIDKIYDNLNIKIIYKLLSKFEKIDRYAFERADYIFFPCKEAEEPYYNNWPFYKKIKERKQNKYRYILTGITQKKAKLSKNVIRKKLGIPNNAFVITYVGRHNEVKGYDKIKEIANELLKNNSDIYFLCAGKEEPLHGIDDSHWIEVGWTDDPYSIINSGDLFILPNKETYFDIVFLEVISMGKMILATKTGGNKHFLQYNSSGIKLYSDIKEAIEYIYKIKNNKNNQNKINRELISLFNKYFSAEKFAKNYVDLIKKI